MSKTFTREELNINQEIRIPVEWDQFYSLDDQIISALKNISYVTKINKARKVGTDEGGFEDAYTDTIISVEVQDGIELEQLQKDIQRFAFEFPNLFAPKAETKKVAIPASVILEALHSMKPQSVREVESDLNAILENLTGSRVNDGFIDRVQFSSAMRRAFEIKPEVHPLVKSALELGEKQFKDWYSSDFVTYWNADKRDAMSQIVRQVVASL